MMPDYCLPDCEDKSIQAMLGEYCNFLVKVVNAFNSGDNWRVETWSTDEKQWVESTLEHCGPGEDHRVVMMPGREYLKWQLNKVLSKECYSGSGVEAMKAEIQGVLDATPTDY